MSSHTHSTPSIWRSWRGDRSSRTLISARVLARPRMAPHHTRPIEVMCALSNPCTDIFARIGTTNATQKMFLLATPTIRSSNRCLWSRAHRASPSWYTQPCKSAILEALMLPRFGASVVVHVVAFLAMPYVINGSMTEGDWICTDRTDGTMRGNS